MDLFDEARRAAEEAGRLEKEEENRVSLQIEADVRAAAQAWFKSVGISPVQVNYTGRSEIWDAHYASATWHLQGYEFRIDLTLGRNGAPSAGGGRDVTMKVVGACSGKKRLFKKPHCGLCPHEIWVKVNTSVELGKALEQK